MHNNCSRRRTRIVAAAIAGAAAAVIAAVPTASAGPAQDPNALEVITALQRQGDKVIISRTGNKPLQYCAVTSVREISAAYWWTRPHVRGPVTRAGTGTGAVVAPLIERTFRVEIRC